MPTATERESGSAIGEGRVPASAADYADYIDDVRPAPVDPQRLWAERPIRERLRVLKAARHQIAAMADEFVSAMSVDLARSYADTLVAEVLPLLAAGRFLEQRAEEILRVRWLGRKGLPFWLGGLDSEVRRVPFGRVLVIGPSNYPLFLPGVQALQGLAAGNSVVWKPGRGGGNVAKVFERAMYAAGLPEGLLRVTGESVEAAQGEIAAGVGKVFFTGSATSGRTLLKQLAQTLTPCVAELSGCDAVVVLPSAELSLVVKALVFGMRLNGSATCMAPRRVLLVRAADRRREEFLQLLQNGLGSVPGISLTVTVRQQVQELLDDARRGGATILGDADTEKMKPVLVIDAKTSMGITSSDVFAPVLALMDVADEAEVLAVQEACPFALTASIFGDENESRRLASKLTVGTVLINDVIVSTADPRLPFGGRGRSGFGVTRGAEGLLEMTAVKTISARRGRSVRRYEATGEGHAGLFSGFILASHSGGWRVRLRGVNRLIEAGRKLKGN